MRRRFLLAAAVAPLVAAAGQAAAQVKITNATTTPVATATANAGAPSDVEIVAGGSIAPGQPGAAVTLNSNNTVTNQGSIGFKDESNSEGILVLGGFTGQVVNSGQIGLSESYQATDHNNDGLPDGPFAQGANRFGIEVAGPGTFNGSITDSGAITIQGNTSDGLLIGAPITGDLLMQQITPSTTSGNPPAVGNGTISVTGANVVGAKVTATGGVGGNAEFENITATGPGARGIVIAAPVGGGVNIAGAVSVTGYRSPTFSDIPSLLALYTPDELQQSGPAVKIGASVAKGVLVSAAPRIVATSATADADHNGVPDQQQTSANVTSYGAAPAMKIGATGNAVTLGPVTLGTGPTPFGLVVQGNLNANGVYDTVSTPHLPGPVPATALDIGSLADGATTIAGGMHNIGVIDAVARQANTTGIRIGAGASVPVIKNAGSITAATLQVSNLTTGFTPLQVNGIFIHKGATVTTIDNSFRISATLTGASGIGGDVGAIIDKSGTISAINNSGQIAAQLVQTVSTLPFPATSTTTAIWMAGGTQAQSITQTLSPLAAESAAYSSTTAYAAGALVNESGGVYEATTASAAGVDAATTPTIWRQVGFLLPSISGNIKFGNGGSTLTVDAGTVVGPIDLGAGVNTININGPSTTTSVTGAISDEGGQFGANIASGVLSDLNPVVVGTRALGVGANGALIVDLDPAHAGHATNTKFLVHGPATFAQGAQIGLTMSSLQSAPAETYTIVKTVPGQGSLSAGTFTTGTLGTTPFLYNSSAALVPAASPATSSKIELTVTRKTADELGFNASEATALDPILTALPANAGIQQAILAQTTQAGLKSVYDQLLPNQGQGLFEALDAAAQSVSLITANDPNPGGKASGSSLWLQEVNERVDRKGLESQGSNAKLLGLVGGLERPVWRGHAGLELAYFNDQEQDTGAAVGEHVIASMFELGAYWRQTLGPLTIAARGGGGYAWFSSDRRFLTSTAFDRALADWGGVFADGHFQVNYEHRLGRFYAGPQASLDYLWLKENGHAEQPVAGSPAGSGAGFDLAVAGRTSNRLSGAALMVVGAQFGSGSWLRTELRAGWREVFSGQIGDTIAEFQGGSPFTLSPDNEPSGWATIGASIKAGSPYSYVALEGDADFRNGEQRYDVIVAGRSVF